MKPRPRHFSAWADRRRRKWTAWWGGHFRRIHDTQRSAIALFCDCEGHHAGPEGEQFADAGLQTLLDLLARCRLHATFHIVADLCELYPERVRRIADAGHEIACHGLHHERPRDLIGPELDEMLTAAQAAFARLKLRAVGFRSPQSAWSMHLARRLGAHGFKWSAERDSARKPYRFVKDLTRVPVLTDDWDLAERKVSPSRLTMQWREQVGRAIARDRVLAFGVHEWLFGREPEYAKVFEQHIEWLRTHLELKIVPIGELMKDYQTAQTKR